MIRLLKRKDITEVELGDHVDIETSILFGDLRGFTSLSEQLTPGGSFRFLSDFLEDYCPLFPKHKGFIDKFPGDGFMTLFPGEAVGAVEAAVDIQKHLFKDNHERIRQGLNPIRLAIGINYGKVVLGTLGYKEHMQGTVVGDAVNVASRLESFAKEIGSDIIVSERLLKQSARQTASRYLGGISVKGRTDPVSVYEIFEHESPEDQALKMASKDTFESLVGRMNQGSISQAEYMDLHRDLLDLAHKYPKDQILQYFCLLSFEFSRSEAEDSNKEFSKKLTLS